MTRERFEGCLLGLALGDALGAPREGGPVERLVWRLIGRTRAGDMRWTDDTQMALDLAASLAATGDLDQDDLARRFAASYRWSRGYGPGAAKVLKRIERGADWRDASRSVYPEGSFGNGGAMRAPVVGAFFAHRLERLPAAAEDSARVTHAHPLALEGAVLVATVTAHALLGASGRALLGAGGASCRLEPYTERLGTALQWIEDDAAVPADVVRARLGNGIAAAESCVTTMYLATRFLRAPFTQLVRFVAEVGGDVDTIGAMAGAVWGAANGISRLPAEALARVEGRQALVEAAGALWARSEDSHPGGREDAPPLT